MKVYLVENSEVIRARLRGMMLDVPGAVVLGEAAGQDEAIAGIAASKPDVVLLDIGLAQGSGIDVLRQVRPLYPHLRIIVVTSRNDDQYRNRCLALGADLFLDKGRDLENLPRHLLALGVAPSA